MTGADEAHYRFISKTSSRLVNFPDNVPRHITLSNWHWEVVDRLQKEQGWKEDQIPTAAFEHVVETCAEPGLFEDDLRLWFRLIIEASMPDFTGSGERVVANERFLPAPARRRLAEIFSLAASEVNCIAGPGE